MSLNVIGYTYYSHRSRGIIQDSTHDSQRALGVHRKSRVLLEVLMFVFQHTPSHLHVQIQVYMCSYYVRVIQYLQSHPLRYNTFSTVHYFHFQLANFDYFSINCLGEVIFLCTCSWCVDNLMFFFQSKSISSIKVLYSNV